MFGTNRYHGGRTGNPGTMLLAVIGIIFSVIFFLQKLSLFSMAFEIQDGLYIYFFAGFTFIAGIILLWKSLGLEHMMYR